MSESAGLPARERRGSSVDRAMSAELPVTLPLVSMASPPDAAPGGASIDWRGAALPALLLLLWLGAVDTGFSSSPLLVPLHRVVAAPFVDADGREVWAALGTSLGRLGLGLAIGGSIGIVTGLLLGLARGARQAVSPTLHGLRQVALFAWIPLLTSWFGTGEAAKIVFISISAFFPLFLATEAGVRGVSAGVLEAAAVLRLDGWNKVRRVVFPAALDQILVGLEIALVLVGVALMAFVGYALHRASRSTARALRPWSVS